MTSYHAPMSDESLGFVSAQFKKWMPDHKPIWTAIGVAKLAEEEMRIEIEVVAYDSKENGDLWYG